MVRVLAWGGQSCCLRDDRRSVAVEIRIAGGWRSARALPVVDPAESLAEHERLFRDHAWFRWLAGIARAHDGGPDVTAVMRATAAGECSCGSTWSRRQAIGC
jgi:hypothetical protein